MSFNPEQLYKTGLFSARDYQTGYYESRFSFHMHIRRSAPFFSKKKPSTYSPRFAEIPRMISVSLRETSDRDSPSFGMIQNHSDSGSQPDRF
jgi:hypothetical protein